MIEIDGVGKRYGGQAVLSAVGLKAGRGECVGVIGPNGAGKTTFLRLMVGLLAPDEGHIALAGLPPREAAATLPITYFAGERALPRSLRAKEWARMVSNNESIPESALEGLGQKRLGRLSSGNRQMLALRTMLEGNGAPLVILDEPWEHLDPGGARWLSRRILELKSQGVTFVVSSHRLFDLAGLCSSYGFLVGHRLHMRSSEEIALSGEVEAEDLFRVFDELSAGTSSQI